MAETNIKITADTRQAERDIKRLETALDGINSVGDGAATALAAITAAAAGMGYAILKTLDAAGALIDASKALGISAQNLQVLQHAAALTGVSAEELNGSLMRLQNNLGSGFAQGTGAAVDAMKRLGIPMETIMGMRADKQFETIAAELNKIPNPAERSALAIDLLGKQGPRLLEIAANAEAVRKEMEAMGLALSDIDVAALDMAGDSVDELKGIFDAGLKKAVADIAPYIVAIVDKIKEAIKEAGGFEVVWARIKAAIKTALNIAIFTAAIFAFARMASFAVGLVTAIRSAGVAMGVFNAIVMRNPLMLAVGAALLLAKVLGIDVVGAVTSSLIPTLDLEKANKNIADKAAEIKNTNEANVEINKEANKEQQKALDALKETLSRLEQSVKFEQDKVALGEAQANINKMIAEESEKLAKVGQTLSSQAKRRIAAAYTELQAIKEQAALTKVLTGLETDRLGLSESDKNQREIILAIRKQEVEFNRQLTESERSKLTTAIRAVQEARAQESITKTLKSLETDRLSLLENDKNQREIQTAILKTQEDIGRVLTEQEKTRLTTAIEAVQQARAQESITKTLKGLEDERLLLAIADKDQREITSAILKTQQDIGRSLNADEKERLTTAIKLTQQAREQGAIAESIFNYTRKQTELEKINRGINLQSTLDPMGSLNKQYAQDEEALKAMLDRKLISEMEYYTQREELGRQYNQKMQDIELKRIETVLQSQTSALAVEMSEKDRAFLQAVGAQERQKAIVTERINFEKKSELEKAQFGVEQAANMFSALGKENKKAFEASKALNIASAIMNTYQAATKALATYPFPFGLIAAAGAIAAGMAQVSVIRSQSYSGRALGGPVMGGRSYMVGESGPELFTPSTTGSITRNQDLGSSAPTNINFTIVANDTQGFDQLLSSRKGVIQQIISDAMLERGQRSMV